MHRLLVPRRGAATGRHTAYARWAASVLSLLVLLALPPPLAAAGAPGGMNVPPSLGAWREYGVVLGLALVVLAVQAALIAILVAERRRRLVAQQRVLARLEYERLVADVSREFVRSGERGVVAALGRALARLGAYTRATAAAVLDAQDGAAPRVTVTWAAPGATVPSIPADRVARLAARARSGRPAHATLDASSDDDAAAETRGPLVVPLSVDQSVLGALVLFGAPADSDELGTPGARLSPVADVFASALARERAARAAQASEALGAAVLASLSARIAILDRDGRIVRVNQAWRDFAERSGVPAERDALVGADYVDETRRAAMLGHPAEPIADGVRAVLDGRARHFAQEYDLSHDGERRWYDLLVEPLHRPEGGAVVSHLDVTANRTATLELEQKRREVARLGRVATMGEMAAALSHELRQPLTAIRANAQAARRFLSMSPPRLDEVCDILQDIEGDDAVASEVIDRVRALVRSDRADGERPREALVQVNDVCRGVARLLHSDAVLRQTRLELELDPLLPLVSGDAVQLQQLVINLVVNALDAVSAGDGTGRVVTVRTRPAGDGVELLVADTGPGIDDTVAARLFEPFFTTKVEGLGMGLAIVRSIVESHRGRVCARTAPPGGAEFVVSLPG